MGAGNKCSHPERECPSAAKKTSAVEEHPGGWGMKNNGIRSALHKLPGINFNFYATQKLQKQPEFPTRVGAIQNQK